jgi:hypothetical protein
MNRYERLADITRDWLTADLLRSVELDEAPDNTANKVAIALGLGTSALMSTTTTTAAATAGIGATPLAAGATTATGLLKVMAVVTLTCGTLSYGGVKLAMNWIHHPEVSAAGGSAAMRPSAKQLNPTQAIQLKARDLAVATSVVEDRESTEPASPVVSASGTAPASRQTKSQAGDITARSTSAEILQAPARSRAVAPTGAFPPIDGQAEDLPVGATAGQARRAVEPDLQKEVAQLDSARQALAAGQPVSALHELDLYRGQWPRGALTVESIVLRVKALLAAGHRQAAEREALPVLTAAPQSRHAQRLRELLSISAVVK